MPGLRNPDSINGSMNAVHLLRLKSLTGAPIRILPLGDSITHSEGQQYGYRYYLWIRLLDAGINFDFVGSMRRNFVSNPKWPKHRGRSFDSDHEGHWGWSADQILNGFPHRKDQRLAEWLKDYTPDIVLIHLGTNDALQRESSFSTTNELKLIIETLRKDNPNVVILVAKLIPVRDKLIRPLIDEFNARLDTVAGETGSISSPVIIVDHYSGFDDETDLQDWLHPNQRGEQKMAERWFEAIRNILEI